MGLTPWNLALRVFMRSNQWKSMFPLMGFTEFHRFHLISMNFIWFYWMSIDFTEFQCISKGLIPTNVPIAYSHRSWTPYKSGLLSQRGQGSWLTCGWTPCMSALRAFKRPYPWKSRFPSMDFTKFHWFQSISMNFICFHWMSIDYTEFQCISLRLVSSNIQGAVLLWVVHNVSQVS